MLHSQGFGDGAVIRRHHVVVVVVWKLVAQPIAGFAGLAVPDLVREDDVVPRGIQELPRPEEHAGELLGQERLARSPGPVKDQHRVVSLQCAHRGVVKPQFRQRFAAVEAEIANGEVGLDGRRIVGGGRGEGDQQE